ncbi:MAG: efflux RND transporter periplasmic adaptor subunit [Novosphingobium sp.]
MALRSALRSRLLFTFLVSATLCACSGQSEVEQADPMPGLEQMIRQGFVKVERVGDGAGGLGLPLPARVAFEAQGMAAIDTPVAARIVSISVHPGVIVKRGDPLVTLVGAEVAGTRSDVTQASARLAAAEDMLRRQNEMLRRGVGTEVERFGAETAAREARAEYARASRASALIGGGDGGTFTLRAPVSGTVLSLKASVGSMADAGGDPIMEIGDPTRLWVVADAAESDLTGVRPGMDAQVTVAGVTVPGKVDGVGSLIDSDQRRIPIYLRLSGKPAGMTAGMLAEVRLPGQTAITVPTDAVLVKDGGQRVVYVRTAKGADPRPVQVGVSRGGRIVISSGLKPGEIIITHGALLLDSSASQQL